MKLSVNFPLLPNHQLPAAIILILTRRLRARTTAMAGPTCFLFCLSAIQLLAQWMPFSEGSPKIPQKLGLVVKDLRGDKTLQQVKSDKGKKIQVFYSITGMGADKPPCALAVVVTPSVTPFAVGCPLAGLFCTFIAFQLFFHAASSTGNAVEEPTETVITVVDPNDNKPEFTRVVFEASVMERAHPGTSVMQITARDADDHENTYNTATDPSAKLSQDPSVPHPNMLTINQDTGIIAVLTSGLDQQIASVYTLTIQAADLQGEGLRSTGTAVITVTHSNANPPGFSPTLVEVDTELLEAPPLTHTSRYTGQVFENKVDAGILRLKVKREDAPGSPAGKAVFSILNDRAGLYTVTTDPETNNGLLKTAKVGVSSKEVAAVIDWLCPP
ncbi:LOW QUALITY PROTEIN: cadherin-1-like [Felis catus]|uniref:LOW QUALITY PROTEIN: cadherin-1-like n=1 Tax=Felis catus TaxID=9685 RepID=UPI001D19B4F7|nr:LOW QUALITY PROTEIN: cadherin-1-like [Felis catus]